MTNTNQITKNQNSLKEYASLLKAWDFLEYFMTNYWFQTMNEIVKHLIINHTTYTFYLMHFILSLYLATSPYHTQADNSSYAYL